MEKEEVKNKKRWFGKEMLCKSCGNDTFKILLNAYADCLLVHPHFEMVCDKCDCGFVIIPNSNEFEKHLRKSKEVKQQ